MAVVVQRFPNVKQYLNEKPLLERFVNLIWVVGICCVIYGFYAAWQRQCVRARELNSQVEQLTVPSFDLDILQANIGSLSSGSTQVLFVSNLTNRGADAAVVGNTWSAEIITPDGNVHSGSAALLNSTIDLCQGKKTRRFVPEDALYLKASDVIKRNGYQQGVLAWIFPVNEESVKNPQTVFKISAKAVGGVAFAFTKSVADLMSHSEEEVYMPGLKFPLLLDKPCK